MTPIDLWAALAAFAAASGLLMRRHMLSRHMALWADGPGTVQAVLALTAMAIGASAVSIVSGHHASGREALAYSAVAVMAWTMVVNLHRNGRTDRPAPAEH